MSTIYDTIRTNFQDSILRVTGEDYLFYLYENHHWDITGVNELVEKIIAVHGSDEEVDHRALRDYLKQLDQTANENVMDQNQSLLGFSNGVYDLRTRTFRDGERADMISCPIGYDYHPYDPESGEVQAVWEYLRSVFPEEGRAESLVRTLASHLFGTVPPELLIFYGTGANGKTVLAKLLSDAVGSYLRYIDPISSSAILHRILPGARFTRMAELDTNHPIVASALERVYQMGCTPIVDCYNAEYIPADVPHQLIEFKQTFATACKYQPPCTPAALCAVLIHHA